MKLLTKLLFGGMLFGSVLSIPITKPSKVGMAVLRKSTDSLLVRATVPNCGSVPVPTSPLLCVYDWTQNGTAVRTIARAQTSDTVQIRRTVGARDSVCVNVRASYQGRLSTGAAKACAVFANADVQIPTTPPAPVVIDTMPTTPPVVIPPPTGGTCVNRPAGMTTRSEIDFSQNIPAPNGSQPVQILPTDVWVPFSAVSRFTKVTDTDPVSPGSAWRIDFPAGVYGSPTSGTGFGDFGFGQNLFAPWTSEVYVCAAVKWDSNFEWHPVSNKFFELGNNGLQLLVQSREGGWPPLNASSTAPGWRLPVTDGSPITLGGWHVLEITVKYGAIGTVAVWLDGVMRTNATASIPGGPTGWQEMYVRNFRGGGGETKTRLSSMWYGHILVAGKP